jgi:CheY-like chemotaxis protein
VLPLLRGEPPHTTPYRPDLVLLDLNLPKKHGRDVLAEIKGDPQLKSIPVIVLTTSDHDQDIAESYARFANAYVTKPLSLEQFVRIVQSIEDFWLTIVRLPPKLER